MTLPSYTKRIWSDLRVEGPFEIMHEEGSQRTTLNAGARSQKAILVCCRRDGGEKRE